MEILVNDAVTTTVYNPNLPHMPGINRQVKSGTNLIHGAAYLYQLVHRKEYGQ